MTPPTPNPPPPCCLPALHLLAVCGYLCHSLGLGFPACTTGAPRGWKCPQTGQRGPCLQRGVENWDQLGEMTPSLCHLPAMAEAEEGEQTGFRSNRGLLLPRAPGGQRIEVSAGQGQGQGFDRGPPAPAAPPSRHRPGPLRRPCGAVRRSGPHFPGASGCHPLPFLSSWGGAWPLLTLRRGSRGPVDAFGAGGVRRNLAPSAFTPPTPFPLLLLRIAGGLCPAVSLSAVSG